MADPDTLQAERRALRVSTIGALVVGCNGLVFSFFTGAQAILLDGLFNLTYFATGLFTLKVVDLLLRGDDERFPMGYGFFEPLVNGIKGILMLWVTLVALVGAFKALLSGGREIALGLAVVYGVLATIACWTVAALVARGAKKANSPLVSADAAGWVVNAAISSAVLGTLLVVFLIRETSLRFLVPYVDPALVLLVGGVTIGVPVRLAWQALMALLNRTPSAEVLQEATSLVKRGVADLPVKRVAVRVLQPGRTRVVFAHVLLDAGFSGGVERLDEIRAATAASLLDAYPQTEVDLVFTQDDRWYAPFGDDDRPTDSPAAD